MWTLSVYENRSKDYSKTKSKDYSLANIFVKNWTKCEEVWLGFVLVIVTTDFRNIVLR